MATLLDCFRLDLHHQRMRDSFWYFTENTVLKRLARRVEAPHQKVIADAVQELADDPEGGILLVCVPPGGAKSLICARSLPAWIMGRQPGARVLAVTNTMPLVESHGRAVREIIQTKGYQQAFDTSLSQQQAAASAFATDNRSEFFGVGSAGASLGRRAEWIIVDDPIGGIEEAQSVTQMQKLHAAWSNNILTRVMPGTKIVVIQQRLSVNDLVGHILANPVEGGMKVRYVRLPMLCDDPVNDPLGREMGQELWPQYWTKGMLADAQADPLKWRTLYMQKPYSEGAEWFKAESIHPTPVPQGVKDNKDWRILMGVDLAYTPDGGDATVFVVVGFEKKTAAMHVLDMYRKQVGDAQSVEDLLTWIECWKPDWLGVDADTVSNAYVNHLKTRAVGRGVHIGMLEQMPLKTSAGKSKDARALPLRLKADAGLLHIDRGQWWSPVLLRELTAFPNATGSAVDDCVDALAIVARKTSNMVASSGSVVVSKPVIPPGHTAPLDEMFQENEGRGGGFSRKRL